MKLGFSKRPELHWSYVDCVEVRRFDAETFPCSVGPAGHCHLDKDRKGQVIISPTATGDEVLINGIPLESPQIVESECDYSVKAAGKFFLLRGDSSIDNWVAGLNFQTWILQDIREGRSLGAMPFGEIAGFARENQLDGTAVITTLQGARQAFYLKDVVSTDTLTSQASAPAPAHPSPPKPPSQDAPYTPPAPPPEPDPEPLVSREIDTVHGEFTCPHCWEHFDRPDVMWIAKHPSLRDPDLGEDFALRFFPTAFDDYGRAVDGMGVRCNDMACPNCKSRLPPQFLDLETRILSIVGAPSAGKSYYLTSLINELEESLPRHFGLAFKDSDASANALVSDMRAKLFSDSPHPADIALDKTVPGGEMFKSWERDGRRVKLPKPFTYLVSPFTGGGDSARTLHLVFYDNAGEQFEPAERSESGESSDLDTTQHLAASAAILFLYDPASNVRFRKMLRGAEDPQLTDEKFLKLNRQDNIIAEMRNRIVSELNIDANDRIETPLLMLIGKCDLWSHLLDEPFTNPVGAGGLDLSSVEANSAKVREFLLEVAPGVVANAESISRTVVYFPVSPIGHSPQKFIPPGGEEERIGPVPGKVAPLYPEVPVLWTLARLHPEMISVKDMSSRAAP